MKNRYVLLSTAAMLVLAAGTAAQTEPIRDQTNQPPSKDKEVWRDQPGNKNYDPNTRINDPNARPGARSMKLELVPTSSAIGTNVYGNDGEKIGDVNDLILSRADGRITYALVGRGGVLGVGEKVVPVPFNAFGWDTQKKAFTLPVNKDRMKEAPTLDKGEWTSLNDSAKTDQFNRYFSVQSDADNADDLSFRNEFKSNLPADQRPLVRVSEVKGKKLMADDGRELGRVEELVYDSSTGRIAFAIVTFGGALGFGEDKVPVPWTMLDVNRDGRLVAVGLEKEKVRTAPRLSSRDGTELRDSAFASRLYAHYGKQAPWLDRYVSTTDVQERWVTEYDGMYNAGKNYQITGVIESVETVTPVQGAPEITCATIRSESNETVSAQLAPRNYLDGEKVGLKEGDRVTVRGKLVERDGKRYLIATDITPSSGRAITLRKSDGSSTWRH